VAIIGVVEEPLLDGQLAKYCWTTPVNPTADEQLAKKINLNKKNVNT